MGTYEVIDVPFTETWKAMEKCVDMGLVKNIGISSESYEYCGANVSRLFEDRTGYTSEKLSHQARCAPTRTSSLSSAKRFHEIPQRGGTVTVWNEAN